MKGTSKVAPLSHGSIQNDFDVHEWAAPEFAKEAVKQLVDERWTKVAYDKLSLEETRLG